MTRTLLPHFPKGRLPVHLYGQNLILNRHVQGENSIHPQIRGKTSVTRVVWGADITITRISGRPRSNYSETGPAVKVKSNAPSQIFISFPDHGILFKLSLLQSLIRILAAHTQWCILNRDLLITESWAD